LDRTLDVLGVRWSSRLDHRVGAALGLCRRLTSAPVLADFNIDVGPSVMLGHWIHCPVSPAKRIGPSADMVGDHLDPESKRCDTEHVDLVHRCALVMKRWLWRVCSGPIIVGALTILELRLWHL
jgi:hypothetical protein